MSVGGELGELMSDSYLINAIYDKRIYDKILTQIYSRVIMKTFRRSII